jgi:hypothetical protein
METSLTAMAIQSEGGGGGTRRQNEQSRHDVCKIKSDGLVWAVFIWLRIGTSGGLLSA